MNASRPASSKSKSRLGSPAWQVERVIHFDFDADLCKDGYSHFGFRDRAGRLYAIWHQRHFLGLVDSRGELAWTAASRPVLEGVPNITADLEYPMFVDTLPDGSLAASNFLSARIHCICPDRMEAELLVDGPSLGMKDAGNCVVGAGCIWVNEVTGCRLWAFDMAGRPVETLGDGRAGFQREETGFEQVRFGWIYDIRRGPDGCIYVLDSGNFAVRAVDPARRRVSAVAGTGVGGYSGDGGDARQATFGSNPGARFDGPISLSLDEQGNIFVGDRHNHVVRMIRRSDGVISTIAGRQAAEPGLPNNLQTREPLELNLPEISSMDYHGGRLFVPTDLTRSSGDLTVLRRTS